MILPNFFVAGFAKLPLIPPYLSPGNNEFTNGLNFASAGAGALTETNVGMVCDLCCVVPHHVMGGPPH
jgi:hypothetical protein